MRKALIPIWSLPLLAACGRVAEGQPDAAAPVDSATPTDVMVDSVPGDSPIGPDGCPTTSAWLGCSATTAGKICSSEAWSCQESDVYSIRKCTFTPGGWLWQPTGERIDDAGPIISSRNCDAAKHDGGVFPDGCPTGPTYVGCNATMAGKTCSTRPWACTGAAMDTYQVTECIDTPYGWTWRPKGSALSCFTAGAADAAG